MDNLQFVFGVEMSFPTLLVLIGLLAMVLYLRHGALIQRQVELDR
jgi:hypothetical protein